MLLFTGANPPFTTETTNTATCKLINTSSTNKKLLFYLCYGYPNSEGQKSSPPGILFEFCVFFVLCLSCGLSFNWYFVTIYSKHIMSYNTIKTD